MNGWLSLLVALRLAPEPADDPVRAFTSHPEALPHVRRAIELSAAEQDVAAVEELERAASLDDSWRIAFLLGRALRNAGRCDDARVQHARVLREGDDAALLEESRLDLADCGFAVPRPPDAAPSEPVPVGPEPEVGPAPPRFQPSVELGDGSVVVVSPRTLGPALLGAGGGVVIATGAALAIVGSVRVQGARSAPSIAQYDRQVRGGQLLGGIGWGLAVAGTALVGAAVAVIVQRRRRPVRRVALRGGAR
ncbi:MAG: hypothetical protein AAF721_01785 [Myxococcota bacterium]